MGRDLGDSATGQAAADRAPDLASWLNVPGAAVPAQSADAAACAAVRMIAIDVMIFAGMEPEQALRAIQPDSYQEPPNMWSQVTSGTVYRVSGSAKARLLS
jgi:hypothetical protein